MALKCECGGEIRETIDNKDECIICGNSKKGDGKMAQIPEQTYVEIAEPFGKQFRDAIREAYARGYADGKQISEMLREEYTQEKVCDVQRQRDRIIEKAKDEVEVLKSDYDGLYEVNNHQSKLSPYVCTADFIVNKDKRTIVALLRGKHSSKVRAKGIAKCVPGDCFNIHIGKAVALRKALGKSIDDYMNVPNPTEVRVGDYIYISETYPKELVGETHNSSKGLIGYKCAEMWANEGKLRIIDDSREVSE